MNKVGLIGTVTSFKPNNIYIIRYISMESLCLYIRIKCVLNDLTFPIYIPSYSGYANTVM